MGRLAVIAAFATSMLFGALAADARQSNRVFRIGLLDSGEPDAVRNARWGAFRQQMREFGYVEGQNVTFESRWPRGEDDRLSKLAAELVNLKVDIIVSGATSATLAAKQATSAIPIVTTIGSDPVALGFAASLQRPGGNVTGMSSISSELASKRLEFLLLVVPTASSIAILWDDRDPGSRLALKETERAARIANVDLKNMAVRSPADIDAAFSALARTSAAGLSITTSPTFLSQRTRLAELAIKHRLPTVGGNRAFVEAGGLAAYGTDYIYMFGRAATFVDKILKGAKPGELPIERPTKFEFIINLKTAKSLGITIPPALLQRADQVIQ